MLAKTMVTNAGKEVHNSHKISTDGLKHSTPRVPKVVDFTRCSNADFDWYGRMPADPPPVDPKVEMPPEPCKKVDAILELTFTTIE